MFIFGFVSRVSKLNEMEDHVKTVRSALGALDDRREDDKAKVKTISCKQSTTITII